MKQLLELYRAFIKIGAVTFGGGYAMLPIIQRDIVEKRGWATKEEIADYYAIGQCTPGIIAINTATFVGYKQKGVAGGIVSQFGDLTASIFKRKIGIKDYGTLIPGHGGIMDRFDSVLFTAPMVYYTLYILNAF